MFFLIFFLDIYLTGFSLAHQPCISRDYGNGGTVCVCNNTYCDTIPKPQKLNQQQVLMYTSNKAGKRFYQTKENFPPLSPGEWLPLQIPNTTFIDSAKQYQTIFGWGGAFTDATGINIKSLGQDLQTILLKSYFSDEGIEYSLCRVPMGSTDFSTRTYSYNDGAPDPNLTNFKLEPEDLKFKIPFIREALKLKNNNLLLYTSAWAAPPWMKTNNNSNGFRLLKNEHYQTWADYFLKFLDAYRQHGINFWGITTGNEPTMDSKNVEVVNWQPSLLGKWIKNNLGPTLRNSNYSRIKIMTLDDMRYLLPWFVEKTLDDEIARQYIDGIGVHWYSDEQYPAELLNMTHDKFPEKFILATEACIRPSNHRSAVSLGDWDGGERYSRDIIEDLNHWVTGWVDWNMALNMAGGPNFRDSYVDSTIIVDAEAGEFYKQPMFYHLGHFSKFIPRGSVRIYSEMNLPKNVYGVALKRPDNGIVVVFLNRNSEEVFMNIIDKIKGFINVKLTPNSINTILYG